MRQIECIHDDLDKNHIQKLKNLDYQKRQNYIDGKFQCTTSDDHTLIYIDEDIAKSKENLLESMHQINIRTIRESTTPSNIDYDDITPPSDDTELMYFCNEPLPQRPPSLDSLTFPSLPPKPPRKIIRRNTTQSINERIKDNPLHRDPKSPKSYHEYIEETTVCDTTDGVETNIEKEYREYKKKEMTLAMDIATKTEGVTERDSMCRRWCLLSGIWGIIVFFYCWSCIVRKNFI